MKIAIVGSGISGLTCAHMLHKKHDITLFEAGSYVGGHTNTIEVSEDEKKIPIDTGLSVFNKKTYPNFSTPHRETRCALPKNRDEL